MHCLNRRSVRKALLGGIMNRTAVILVAMGAVLAAQNSAHAQISDDVVRVGVLTDMNSVFAQVAGAGSVLAYQMAAEDFGGKVLGKRIEIISADHGNKADIAANIAREWFDTKKVDAIADVATSAPALAVQEIIRTKNKIALYSAPGTSDITGKVCAETSTHWSFDTFALASMTGQSVLQQGGRKWALLTSDYAFGVALERDLRRFLDKGGGEVLTSIKVPLGTQDFSSFLLTAQAKSPEVLGLLMGSDATTAIKQAAEFGVIGKKTRPAALLMFEPDVHALGKDAQGLLVSTSFYWGMNEATREWTRRFRMRHNTPPTMLHAGGYAAMTHYLKAIEAAGTDEPMAVAKKMKEMPVNDIYNKNVRIREDGRVMHDMYLAEVKAPSEMENDWDLYRILAKLPGDQVFRPIDEGGCALVKAK